MFNWSSGRGAATPKASNGSTSEGSIDHVATSSRRCQHHVATECQRCAAIAEADQRRYHLEPDYLEPHQHAQLVLKSLQEARKFGNVLAREITALYPQICEKANVAEIATRDLLRELGKVTKKSRLTMKFETGATATRVAYFVPKPKGA
jgi:hypothetical protein